ncbi:MAG: hypothetical protein ABIH23_22485 [bacterium]
MKKKLGGRAKVDVGEAQRVVARHEAARALEDVKRDVASRMESGEVALPSPNQDTEIGSIIAAGQNPEEIWRQVSQMFGKFLDVLGEFAFSWEQRRRFFPDRKVIHLVGLLKGAGYTMQAAGAMDIFKDRVKKLQGGKMPNISVKTGLFSKTTRPMNLAEIAHRFEVEENLPAEDLQGLTGYPGTQRGLLEYVRASLLDDEEVRDMMKRAQRKQLLLFFKGAKLLDAASSDKREKVVLACLVPPDAYQPKSRNDPESLLRYRGLLTKATLFLHQKLDELTKEADKSEEE